MHIISIFFFGVKRTIAKIKCEVFYAHNTLLLVMSRLQQQTVDGKEKQQMKRRREDSKSDKFTCTSVADVR